MDLGMSRFGASIFVPVEVSGTLYPFSRSPVTLISIGSSDSACDSSVSGVASDGWI